MCTQRLISPLSQDNSQDVAVLTNPQSRSGGCAATPAASLIIIAATSTCIIRILGVILTIH